MPDQWRSWSTHDAVIFPGCPSVTGLGPDGPGPGDGLAASWPDGHAPAGGCGLSAIAPQGGPGGPEVARLLKLLEHILSRTE